MLPLPDRPPRDPSVAVRLAEEMCRAVAARYFAAGLEHDDLVQAGRVGAWKAWRDWHPEGGRSYSTFTHLCVESEIITSLKTSQRHKHQALSQAARFEQPLADDHEGGTLADVIPLRGAEPHEQLLAREELKRLLWALNELTDLERIAITGAFAGLSYEQIGASLPAEMLRSSQDPKKTVDNALQRAWRKLADEDRGASAAARRRRRVLLYVPRRETYTPHGAPTPDQAITRARAQLDGDFLDADVIECVKRAIGPDGHERRDTRGRPRPDGRRPVAVWRVVLEASDLPELWAAA